MCLCVCSHAYLRYHMSKLYQIFVLVAVTMAQSFCGGIVVRYVLMVSDDVRFSYTVVKSLQCVYGQNP